MLLKVDTSHIPTYLTPYYDQMTWWAERGDYTMIKINAILHLISFGDPFIHVTCITFVSVVGLVYLYKLAHIFCPTHKLILIITIFFIPSVLFWTAAVHKEVLVLSSLGVLFYLYYKFLKKEITLFKVVVFVFSLVLLSFIRAYIIVLLVPALIAFTWTYFHDRHVVLKNLAVFFVFWFFVMAFDYAVPGIGVRDRITKRRAEFQLLEGNASLPMKSVSSWSDLWKATPEAFNHTLLRPYPKEIKSFFHAFFFLENYLLVILFLLALGFFRRKFTPQPPQLALMVMFFLFSVNYLLIIGWVTNNMGAIARYKSQILPFLGMSLFVLLNLSNTLKRWTSRFSNTL